MEEEKEEKIKRIIKNLLAEVVCEYEGTPTIQASKIEKAVKKIKKISDI